MWFLSPRPHPVPVFPEGWQLPLLPMNFGCKSEAVTLVLHLHNSLAHFQNETFTTKVTRMEVHFRVKLAADTVFRAALFFFLFLSISTWNLTRKTKMPVSGLPDALENFLETLQNQTGLSLWKICSQDPNTTTDVLRFTGWPFEQACAIWSYRSKCP